MHEPNEPATLEGTVFVVDDNENLRKCMQALVRPLGLAVETYSTANEFLEQYDPHRKGCLILDLRLPGMSGLELQEALSLRGYCPPIIFLSAHGDVNVGAEAIRAGAVDFIEKPFAAESLLSRIREAIALDQGRRRKHALALKLPADATPLPEKS